MQPAQAPAVEAAGGAEHWCDQQPAHQAPAAEAAAAAPAAAGLARLCADDCLA